MTLNNAKFVDVIDPVIGDYQLAVIGTAAGLYHLAIRSRDTEGLIVSEAASPATPIGLNEVHHYGFSYGGATQPIILQRVEPGDAGPGPLDAGPPPAPDAGQPPVPDAGQPLPPGPGVFNGGGQRPRDVNMLLTYSAPTESRSNLPSGTADYRLILHYVDAPLVSFAAELNGNTISDYFHPIRNTSEAVTISLNAGTNVLVFSLSAWIGDRRDRLVTDTDKLVFLVAK
jgi:hypothetical protein